MLWDGQGALALSHSGVFFFLIEVVGLQCGASLCCIAE